ncbi:MAG: GMP synthase (glutamine-hydrolyzing), partial [bacterium]
LRDLFKDEVRILGKSLGIQADFLDRHPFPGPGLAIRVLGPLEEKWVEIARKADSIFIGELKRRNLYSKVWQAAAVLLPISTVGVMGDGRTYERVLALRAVTSKEAMTAEATELPWSDLKEIASMIVNEVRGINRVVFDLTSKPPATIEWE